MLQFLSEIRFFHVVIHNICNISNLCFSCFRYEGIIIVRNGGTHGAVSVRWNITRNSTDRTQVSADLNPASGTLRFAEGQMNAVLPLNITQDSLPEEAEAFILRLIPGSVQGGAEVDEPMEVSAWLVLGF